MPNCRSSSAYDLVGNGAKSWVAWCIFFLQFLRRQLNCWRFVPCPLGLASNSGGLKAKAGLSRPDHPTNTRTRTAPRTTTTTTTGPTAKVTLSQAVVWQTKKNTRKIAQVFLPVSIRTTLPRAWNTPWATHRLDPMSANFVLQLVRVSEGGGVWTFGGRDSSFCYIHLPLALAQRFDATLQACLLQFGRDGMGRARVE